MGHDDIGRVLQRGAVSILKVSDPSRLDQPIGLTERVLDAFRRDRFVRIDGFVDVRDHRREGPQPGELSIMKRQVEQFAGRDGPVAILVRAVLSVQQNPVKPQQSSAEVA